MKQRFLSLKISKKVMLCMAILVIVSTAFIGFVSSAIFAQQFQSEVFRQIQNTFSSTQKLLKENINILYQNTTNTMSKPVFQEVYQANQNAQKDPDFLRHYSQINELFTDFKRSNSWVDNCVLLCKNGTIYSTYDVGQNYTLDNFQKEFSQTSIQWLPIRKNPLSNGSPYVIPVCFPLNYDNNLLIFSNGVPSDFVLVVYLDANTVNTSIEQMNSAAFSKLYLADAQGYPLTLTTNSPVFSTVSEETVRNNINSFSTESLVEIIDGKEYRITAQPLNINSLQLVSITSFESLKHGVETIQTTALFLVAVGIVFALGLAAILSQTITTPIMRLVKQVTTVQAGNYKIQPILTQTDELGLMDNAICEMAATIEQQILNIQKTEKLRHKAELDAVTEQMNPHFLYNTLDCIHWEILSGHQSNAADMIENLALFLRLSLNHGSETMSVLQAIRHTEQYINLINHRFFSDVKLIYTVSPLVENVQIPKMILQPLAENSILHGFGGTQPDPAVTAPRITIDARVIGSTVVLTIEDNGKGFSVLEMEQASQTPSEISGHLALYNVRKRLNFLFGEKCTMSFSSIPYYCNRICIEFPFNP